MVKGDELLEWATVFDNRYGTPRAPVEAALSAGQDVLFDIDWQGTQQLREKARADVVSVFILPPSAADLEKRLHSRAQDSDEVIRNRMSRASHEMSHWAEYDYIVINHDVDEAFAEVQSILKAERLKRERRIGLVGLCARSARSASRLGCVSRGPSFASRSSIAVMMSTSTVSSSRASSSANGRRFVMAVVGSQLRRCGLDLEFSRRISRSRRRRVLLLLSRRGRHVRLRCDPGDRRW